MSGLTHITRTRPRHCARRAIMRATPPGCPSLRPTAAPALLTSSAPPTPEARTFLVQLMSHQGPFLCDHANADKIKRRKTIRNVRYSAVDLPHSGVFGACFEQYVPCRTLSRTYALQMYNFVVLTWQKFSPYQHAHSCMRTANRRILLVDILCSACCNP